jgi:hypothetical protein
MTNFEKLIKPFDDSELEWKPQQVGIKNGNPWAMILCYVQARAIQNRLDEVFGAMNWKDEYRFEKNGVICRLSVYCNEKKEWIAKENGSPETDIESFKGGISGAFKRVASSGYGIGRYLYELDTTFAECSMTIKKGFKKSTIKYKDKPPKDIFWKVPTSINSISNNSEFTPKQTPAQTTKARNEWEEKLLRQAEGDESLLLQISDSFKYGIKSEKQYHFYANKLTAMGKG